MEKWKEHFEKVSNEEFPRSISTDAEKIQGNMEEIVIEEIIGALRAMKKRKAMGPDQIPIKIWCVLGKEALIFLHLLFNKIARDGIMPNQWRESTIISLFKGKGSPTSCENYRGIKLLSHTMKRWERKG